MDLAFTRLFLTHPFRLGPARPLRNHRRHDIGDLIRSHKTGAQVVAGAVGISTLCVGSYVYGVLDRGDVWDPSLVLVIAMVCLFIGWLLFSLIIGNQRPEREVGSDAGWGSVNRGR